MQRLHFRQMTSREIFFKAQKIRLTSPVSVFSCVIETFYNFPISISKFLQFEILLRSFGSTVKSWSDLIFFFILWDFWRFLYLYRCVCERERETKCYKPCVCVCDVKKVSAVDYKKISASCWHKCKRPKGWIKKQNLSRLCDT